MPHQMHRNGCDTVPLCIFQKISQQAPEQVRIAAHDDRSSIEVYTAIAGALFCCKREKIDVLCGECRGNGVEATCEQNFVDQGVQLSDVLIETSLPDRIRGFLHQFNRHAHACQRRSQFVRRVGEQALVRAYQLFDSPSRAVEAVGEMRNFIVAFYRDAGRQVARAQ